MSAYDKDDMGTYFPVDLQSLHRTEPTTKKKTGSMFPPPLFSRPRGMQRPQQQSGQSKLNCGDKSGNNVRERYEEELSPGDKKSVCTRTPLFLSWLGNQSSAQKLSAHTEGSRIEVTTVRQGGAIRADTRERARLSYSRRG